MALIFRYLDTVGDGSGETNATGDYRDSPTLFRIAPPSNQSFEIARMIITIKDAGVVDSGAYGNDIELVEGMRVFLESEGGVQTYLTAQKPIMTNSDWGSLCYDVQRVAWGRGAEYILVRWTFAKAGTPVIIDGSYDESLNVELHDDFRRLTGHYFMAQGVIARGGR